MSKPVDPCPVKAAKTKKELHNQSSNSKPSCCDGGVLLRLRVLKHSSGLKKKKSDREALYLGTVAMYRNLERIVPVIKGRPTQLDVGKYCVKFDYGGVEHMHPDEVIACANLYHDQQQIILGLNSKNPPGQELPVISQSSADDASDAKFGRQLLMAHNNWAIGPADMLKLEAERQDFWNACHDKTCTRPTRVEPRWFDNTSDTSVVHAPTTIVPWNLETNETSDNTGHSATSNLPEYMNGIHLPTQNTETTTADSTVLQGQIRIADTMTTAQPHLEPPTPETHAQASKSREFHLVPETWSDRKNHKSDRVLQLPSSSLGAQDDRLQQPNLKESLALESHKPTTHLLPLLDAARHKKPQLLSPNDRSSSSTNSKPHHPASMIAESETGKMQLVTENSDVSDFEKQHSEAGTTTLNNPTLRDAPLLVIRTTTSEDVPLTNSIQKHVPIFHRNGRPPNDSPKQGFTIVNDITSRRQSLSQDDHANLETGSIQAIRMFQTESESIVKLAAPSSKEMMAVDTESSAHVEEAIPQHRNCQATPTKRKREDEPCSNSVERNDSKYSAAAMGPALLPERNSEETALVTASKSTDVGINSTSYVRSSRVARTPELLALAFEKSSNLQASAEPTPSPTKPQDQFINLPFSSSTKVVNQEEDKQIDIPERKLLRPPSILVKKSAQLLVKPALTTDDEVANNNLLGGQTALLSSKLTKVHEVVKQAPPCPPSPKKNFRVTHINETLPEHDGINGTNQDSHAGADDEVMDDISNSLVEEQNAQSPVSLGMLAELASTRKTPPNTKAPVSNDSSSTSAPREGDTHNHHEELNGPSATKRETVVSFSPVPESERRPSPSQRGRSDGSTDSSIHRAGTPKSHNILPVALEERSRRRLDLSAPTLPDLKEHDADDDVPGDRISMPRLIQQGEHDGGAKPVEKERITVGDKRPAADTMMEPPKTIKRQRSIPDGRLIGNRPPLIINRQRSTGSRLSFADEVQIAEPGSFGDTGGDRRPGPAAPSALRRADRQQSMESLQPPSVIRAGDRQGSVESYQSFRSQDSGMQTLTPNSRLTPSLLGPTSTLSPNADTPNTARMEDLYDQLDRQLDECIPHFSPSPKPGSLESPSQRYPSFRPRVMNPKRQSGSTLGEVDQGDLKLHLRNPLDVEKDNISGREHQSNLAGRINQPQLGEGLSSLQIPSTGALNRSKVATPTVQVKKSPGCERNVMSLGQPILNHYQQGRNKTYPNEQTYGIQVQQPLQSMHRMASVDSHLRSSAPMQPDFLKAWLEGSTETQTMDQSFRSSRTTPQSRPFHQGFPQGPGFQPFPYGISTSSPDPRVLMPPTFPQPSIRNLSPYESRGAPMLRAPGYDAYIANRRPEAQPQKRKSVEFGHPRDEVVEGRQVYSRHTLLLWGAHKSDVCPVNGNPRDGCDSVVYFSNEADALTTKDDLCFLQLKCSQRNGGGALFVNYQNSQYPNAPHSYPIRVFRKIKTVNGASDLRYDGLYHVAAIHDDRGRPRSEPSSGCKMFSFLLKRNLAGKAPDQNQCTLEELWEVVQQGDYIASHQQQQRRGGGASGNRSGGAGGNGGGGPTNDLHLPPLSHGGRGSRGGGQQNVNGSVGLMGGLMHPELKRKSSAEVSLIHIRYFDDPQNIEPQQWHHDQHQQQWHHDPHQMQRPQVIFHNRAPSVVPSEQPWGKM